MTLQIYPFSASESKIDGLRIINVKMVTDDRGTVRELYRESSHSEVLPETLSSWKQINLTRTKRGAVRGLHGEAMAKLVTVATGSVFGVYVDTRPDSKTFGAVCNGFQALEEGTEYLYFFDNEWAPGMSGTALTPLDNELGIEWPIPIEKDNREQLSEKDAKAPTLRELKEILKCE